MVKLKKNHITRHKFTSETLNNIEYGKNYAFFQVIFHVKLRTSKIGIFYGIFH